MPNSRLNPSAAPMNSARSVAMATSSITTHIPQTTGAGKVAAAEFGQVAAGGDPQLGGQAWISIAIRLLATTTHSSV